jgi:hypothetical protein
MSISNQYGGNVGAAGQRRGTQGPGAQQEGKLTREVELRTSRIPSLIFLGLAGVSIVGALAAKVMGHSKTANFIGLWPPTILLLGIYNKIVKEEGTSGFAQGGISGGSEPLVSP